MKEVEILVEVFDTKENVLSILKKFKDGGIKNTIDKYYYDPLRENLKPMNLRLTECFRIRQKENINYITYKVDKFNKDDKWIYSDEYETRVESISELSKIIEHLGLKELITINSKKHLFTTDTYEIVFETIENLGNFIEVEFKSEEDFDNVLEIKEKIQEFIKNLGLNISEELNMGKPELMLRRNNK